MTKPDPQSEEPKGLTGAELAKFCARLADDRKASDIVVLYVEKLIRITDYFVIATGRSNRHVHMLADELVHRLKDAGRKNIRRDAHGRSRWTLIDLGDVVVHLFEKDARSFYDLELLWGDADQIDWH